MKVLSHKSYMIRDENIRDLAWDFIADLFQKDERGNLTVFQSYLDSGELENMSDTDVHIELRRLVFSKVDDNIFRFYGEKDPSLRKIIRNIKLAVKDRECKNKVCYRDGYLIVVDDEEVKSTVMPAEFMKIRLCSRLQENMQIPDILAEVIDIIQHQQMYRKRFPLVTLAAIIRDSFVLLSPGSGTQSVRPEADENMFSHEFDYFLNDSVVKIRDHVGPKYLEKGKIKPEHLDYYFRAATEIVKSDFQEKNKDLSQFDQLKRFFHNLEYEQFRKKHRPVLEYMVKLIRQDLISTYKKEWA